MVHVSESWNSGPCLGLETVAKSQLGVFKAQSGRPLAPKFILSIMEWTKIGDGVLSLGELRHSSGGVGRASFHWGGTISALLLLLMNRLGRQSPTQSHLLVLYLFLSLPTVLFTFLRGQFGSWVAFLSVGLNIFSPESFPASSFLFFVITPNWLTDELRDGTVAGVLSLIVGILILVTEFREVGRSMLECNICCFAYFLCVSLLFFFTLLYVCLGA